MIHSLRRHLLDRFVLRPSRHQLAYAPKERVLVTVNRVTDEYFVTPSNVERTEYDLLVLKFPGTAGRAERASNWPDGILPGVRTKVCTWNAPGYGASSGRASLANIAKRASRFWSLLTSELPPERPRIWLVGNSLGCATATHLASRSDIQVEGLILRNPPPLIQTFKHVARRYPLGHLADAIAESVPSEMNLSLTAPQAHVPTVLLQSERDQLVPPNLQMEVFDALPGPKRLVVMEGLDHDGVATDDHEPEIRNAIGWLWEQSSMASRR
ncbi:MAG: hypothetical protein KDB00_09905 [Planctomycetales bacterium]|nr:hypothetical protein [Planctomycetales bacterium]